MTRARTALLLVVLAGVLAGAPCLDPVASASGGDRGATLGAGTQPGPAALPAAQAGMAGEPDRIYKIDTTGAPARGPRGAAVTIVEFSDYQ